MSKRETYKEFYSALNDMKLLEYGSTIPTDVVHELLQIEIPSSAPKRVYDQLALLELAAIDYVRNTLLGQGKYISGTSTGYRILLPSENASQIDLYMESADRKLNRALKLSRNTPQEAKRGVDQTEARILMKKHGLRHKFEPSVKA
jgi:hypothetical protein